MDKSNFSFTLFVFWVFTYMNYQSEKEYMVNYEMADAGQN